jgi:hypothetical protein
MILRRRRAGAQDDAPVDADPTGAGVARARSLLDERPEI